MAVGLLEQLRVATDLSLEVEKLLGDCAEDLEECNATESLVRFNTRYQHFSQRLGKENGNKGVLSRSFRP